MDSGSDFVGRGIAFPMDVNANGAMAVAGGSRKLEQAMGLVLATYPGERPFRPYFGSKIRDFVFEGASIDVFAGIEREVRDSLAKWEPRVRVQNVTVYPDAGEQHRLNIEISYLVKGENDPRNLVFPFYTIPDEGDY
jgi:phage baseplate assembly protein W